MKLFVIAGNTFREAIRNRVLYSLLFFAVVLLLLSTVFDVVTVGQRAKIVKDAGLAAITLFGVLIAIFVGISLVFKEIEQRTIYILLSKPVRRETFLAGKYFGILLILLVEIVLMAFLLLGIASLVEGRVALEILPAVALIFLELSVVAAVALLFSTFSTMLLSAMFALGIWVIGHLTDDLSAVGRLSGSDALRWLMDGIYYFLPDLESFNIRGAVVSGASVPLERYLFAVVYAVIYIALLLTAAVLIFNRRDLK